MDPGGRDPVVGENPFGVLGAGPREPLGAEGERSEGGLEQDAALLPLAHRIALHHAVPPADLLVEASSHPACRMDAQVATELAARRAKARAQEELRCTERANGRARAFEVHARRAIVLAGGAHGTPELLLRARARAERAPRMPG